MIQISVIIPVYKTEQYLNRCVTSILSQTFDDFELILVDDGSPDACPQLCDDWCRKDKRVRVIHKVNGGASSARNAGLDIAKGNWITFVDSDDWLERNSLKILYELVNKYSAQMAFGGMRVARDTNFFSKKVSEKICVWSQKDLLNRFFRIHGEADTHSVCGAIIHRDIIGEYRFIEGKMNEDVDACYFLARKCDLAVCTTEEVYNYFYNDTGVTNSKFNKKKLDLIDIWKGVREDVAKYTPEYSEVCELNYKRAKFTLLTQMNLNGYDHKDVFMKKTKKHLKREVRAAFVELMRWKMPISRKVLLIVDCILP